MKTKAAVAFEPAQPLEIVELDLREPNPDEVLIRLHATGVCHSDLAALDGDNRLGSFPIVLGHEGAGIVETVGSAVVSLAPGDHVVLAPVPQCGRCTECLSGRSNLCLDMYKGFTGAGSPFSHGGSPVGRFMHAGAFTQHTVVLESTVAKVREDAPLDRACLAACSVATGVGAAIAAAGVKPGSTVAVFGMGGIGLNAVQGARLAGAIRIIAVDTNSAKGAVAYRFGATEFINPRGLDGDISTHIQGSTGGGTDVAIEAVGHPELVRQALRSVRFGSGRCVVVGMLRDDATLSLSPEDLGIGRSLRTSAGGDLRGRHDTARLVDWYMQAKLDFDGLVNDTYPLEQINDALSALRAGKVVRNIIDLRR